eukprot:3451741-Amphidinium_carterae.1
MLLLLHSKEVLTDLVEAELHIIKPPQCPNRTLRLAENFEDLDTLVPHTQRHIAMLRVYTESTVLSLHCDSKGLSAPQMHIRHTNKLAYHRHDFILPRSRDFAVLCEHQCHWCGQFRNKWRRRTWIGPCKSACTPYNCHCPSCSRCTPAGKALMGRGMTTKA